MIFKTMAFLFLLCWALPAVSASTKKPVESSSTREIDGVLASYRQAKGIEAKVKKSVIQETIGTEMKSQGTFFFSRGKMRMEIVEPERSILVFDGKYIWLESRFDDSHIEVTKMRAGELRKSNSILAALFDRKDVLKNFKLLNRKVDGEKKTFSFTAKDKKKNDVQSLEIALKDKNLDRISYTDRIENKVTLEFSDVTKGALNADKFVYKPPKGSDVTSP
jgi:outer membrane lipoprotein-sorting protein